MKTAYIVKKGYIDTIQNYFTSETVVHDHLLISNEDYIPVPWVKNVIHNPKVFSFDSIKSAANHLKAIQKNWGYYSLHSQRRGALIADQLRGFPKKPVNFFERNNLEKMGFFTLLDHNTLLYSPDTRSPFPCGQTHFQEFPEGPPSRAYLKLMEALYTLYDRPGPDDICIEIGAAPGGWTWVLEKLCSEVHSYDRSELGYKAQENVFHKTTNAFTLEPQTLLNEVNHKTSDTRFWLFSDIICYPDALNELIEKWLRANFIDCIVATIKFQGEFSLDQLSKFQTIPGAKIYHLFHNKHEVTFFWKKPKD